MSILDFLLVAAIVGWCLYLIFRPKKKHCSGCCESCSGCGKI